MACEHTLVGYNDSRAPVLAHQLVQMVHYFFGCLHLERNNFWPFAEVVDYCENMSVAIWSWLEANLQSMAIWHQVLLGTTTLWSLVLASCRCTSFATWHLWQEFMKLATSWMSLGQ